MDCTIRLVGGLGNQLFEVAAAYAYAKQNGMNLVLPPRPSCKRNTYWHSYLHKFEHMILNSIESVRGPIWRERHFHYKSIPSGYTRLYGFFQSSKYFAKYADELRALFDPGDEIKTYVNTKWGAQLKDVSNSIVLHIRRTDYTDTDGPSSPIHNVCTRAYYERAIDYMRTKNPSAHILVFSDDLEWCRQQPWLADASYIDEPNDSAALYLMSRFKHFIIPNSTFSWWATWLSPHTEKVVCAPNKWFASAGPQDWQDIYEPSWITFPV
jgi:hypothetical protein